MKLTYFEEDAGFLDFCIDGIWQWITPAYPSDGITCPTWIKRLLALDRFEQAGRFHDYLYRTGIVSRRDADDLFWQALVLLGCPKRTAWVAWAAVRMCGSLYYLPASPHARGT